MPLHCAMASTMSTPGMTGSSGKWPTKNGSFIVTFLMPATSVSSRWKMRSTSRNGGRWGSMWRMALMS